jgi:hypothetical protein
MKKGIILLGILSLFSLQANEIKKIGDRSLVETVSEELFINKKNIIIEDVLKINMNSEKTVKLELLIQTNKLNIDLFDMSQMKIVKKEEKESLSNLEKGLVSEITYKAFEKNGKLYIELESDEENIEFLLDIRAEYDSDLYKSINDIYDIVNVEVID